jgi:acetyl esterase/lipase
VSHLLHPHPDIAAIAAPRTVLGGVLLISPRTTGSHTAASFTENADKDALRPETYANWGRWVDGFSPNKEINVADDDFYRRPRDAPLTWWDGFSTRVTQRVFISAGQLECPRDDIIALAETWKQLAGVNVTLVVEPRGIHDSPVMDAFAGRPRTDLMLSIEHWLADTAAVR